MRLIDADALMNAIMSDRAPFTVSMVYRHTANAPAIDAIPVVRCRDCKHWMGAALRCNHPDRKYSFERYFTPDCFCSFGERKMDWEDENETDPF